MEIESILLETARIFVSMFISVFVITEPAGYFWHRFVTHGGKFGERLRFPHWKHHLEVYPPENTRPAETYEGAGDNSFYYLYALCVVGVGSLVPFGALPLRDYLVMWVSASLYGYVALNYFHEKYHLKNHFLHRFRWYRNLMLYHDIHHWAPCNYSISLFYMDRIFGTFRAEIPKTREDIFPGFVSGEEVGTRSAQ